MNDDEPTVRSHGLVKAKTADGGWETVHPCKLTDDDINDDGTINYPPSGECDCDILRPGVAVLGRDVSVAEDTSGHIRR